MMRNLITTSLLAVGLVFGLCGCDTTTESFFDRLEYESQYVVFYRANGTGNNKRFFKLERISEEAYKKEVLR